MKVGDKVGRLFTTPGQNGKRAQVSVEYFSIVKITNKTVFIDEFGRRSDGTYGAREYDINSGTCVDDPFRDYRVSSMVMTRRRINFNLYEH